MTIESKCCRVAGPRWGLRHLDTEMTLRIYRPRGIFWIVRFNVAVYYGAKAGIKITAGLFGFGFQFYTKGCATVPLPAPTAVRSV